jgi:lipoprotein signal peptidase
MSTSDTRLAPRERLVYIVMPVLLMGVLTDQASKSWASLRAVEPHVLVPGYLAAYSVRNTGSLLGLGGDRAPTNTGIALLSIACASLLVRMAYADRAHWREPDYLAGAMVLAGIFGNAWDRLALGHVRDFLVTWATPTVAFNVADLLVVVGGVSLLLARYCVHRRARSDLGFLRRAAA